MILRDQFRYAFSNLRKTRLRTILTAAGVSIGIGAMTSMVSVGLGTQHTVMQAFNEGNILTTVMVRRGEPSEEMGQDSVLRVDNNAVEIFKNIPGVRDVFPSIWLAGVLRAGDEHDFRRIQGLPTRILTEHLEHGSMEIIHGRPYTEGETNVVLLSEYVAGRLVADSVDVETLLGDTLVFDAARAPDAGGVDQEFPAGLPDDLAAAASDLAPMLRAFPIAGMLGSSPMGMFEPVRLELEVVGIATEGSDFGNLVRASLWAPVELIEPLYWQTFPDMESMLTGEVDKQGYPMVRVLAEDILAVRQVQDTIAAMGYTAESILDEIDQVRRGFFFINSLLGSIGGISLFVAAMMIVNTLVMAVWERTREIGLLKSMGATDGDVMRLFLTEAGVIGILGGLVGLALGYVVAKASNMIMNIQFERAGETGVDLVSFTPLLMLGGMAFAVLVSLIAGYYPARRAAKVDPVVALRHF